VIQIPTTAQPKPVQKAAALVVAREADVAAAKARVEAAKTAIQSAAAADRELLADALDRGEQTGTPRVDEALEALAEAERQLSAEELRLDRARDALTAAITAALDTWEAAATTALQKAEQEEIQLVDRLAEAEQQRGRLRVELAWLRNRRDNAKLPNIDIPWPARTTAVINPHAGPEPYTVPALLEHVRAGVERALLSAEQQADAPALRVAS
jgi:hypothetical protein